MANKKTIKQTFPVTDMSCAACAARVEKTLNKIEGVLNASVNYAAATVTVEYNPELVKPEELKSTVQQAGYDMLISTAGNVEDEVEQAHIKKYRTLKARTVWAVILTIPLVIIGMFFMDIRYANQIMWLLSTPLVFWLGRGFFINAWKQLTNKSANMDTLVALSTGIAYFFSLFNMLFPQFWTAKGLHPHVYFEAAGVIITFILLGRLLEEKAKGNTASALKKLIGLQPKTVTIIEKTGEQRVTFINAISTADVLLVKPGEKIAVDGTVCYGGSYVNESMLTGEPVPVWKQQGAKVYAGTINQKGSLHITADKVGNDTLLAQIIRMVQDAQGSKAPIQKMADKIAAVFVPVIIAIAVLSFVVWLLLEPENGFTYGLLAMVTVLVIACPCALGLATPTAIMVGIGKGAEKGILIKDAESLETAKKVDTVVLDKTGTITEGKPVVTDFIWLSGYESGAVIFHSLEKLSEHPLAEAVVNYLENSEILQIVDFESISGKGIQGFHKGRVYYAGNENLLSEKKVTIPDELYTAARKLSAEAKTVIWFANDIQALAVAGITDKIKESSVQAINELHKLRIAVYLLTGDNNATAREIASQTGIENYKAEVLPDEKAKFIQRLQTEGKKVAMVGDGINDSAALAQADLSIAMGKGSDIAMDVAQMTIISSDLMKIPEAINLSQLTVRTIKQNLFWAFIYNLIGVPIAAGILYPVCGFLLNPMVAGAAMALSSVSVVANSLRLKTKKF